MEQQDEPALKVGVFGGSFNPIHLGHVLLAVTTQQTKPIHKLLMVPVFKHARKTNLLPFEDRVEMCKLAVEPFAATSGGARVEVCEIEKQVGQSNAPMLKAIRKKYESEVGRKIELYWICGDDVFTWIEKPKGVQTMAEVAGLIVQRRLHKGSAQDRFYKEPLDETRIRSIAAKLNVDISFIYGELPHFSSTLVRNAPGMWRSFLPQSVAKYLEQKPELLAKLHDSLEADAKEEAQQMASAAPPEKRQRLDASLKARPTDEPQLLTDRAAECILRSLDVVHALQFERGRTGLLLSIGSESTKEELGKAQASTNAFIKGIDELDADLDNKLRGLDEALGLVNEVRQMPTWLKRDRLCVQKRYMILKDMEGTNGWAARYALAAKYNSRVDVILGCIIRALHEVIDKGRGKTGAASLEEAPDMLFKWFDAKEAVGRLRAFVCSGGPAAPSIIQESLKLRQLLHQFVESKERRIQRVYDIREQHIIMPTISSHNAQLGASDALKRLLENVTSWEWLLLGSFAPSTPLPLIHKMLKATNSQHHVQRHFDVQQFFEAASSAIDLMLNETKALAASGCARA